MVKIKILKILIWTASIAFLVGISLSIYAYFIEKSSMGNLAGAALAIVGLIGTIFPLFLLLKEKNQPSIKFDLDLASKLADERLKEEIALRDITIASLKEKLSLKNLMSWDIIVKECLEKGDLKKAIASIDTDASDEETAQKHIRKAQLYILNFQFTEAELHYKQAVTIFPSFETNIEIAKFYSNLNRFNESITYYNKCLTHTDLPQDRALVLNNLGNLKSDIDAYPEAEALFKEALEIRRNLSENNINNYTFLSDVAGTLNNLGLLQRTIYALDESEVSFKEALKIQIELSKKNRDLFLSDLAGTLDNLASVQSNKCNYSDAQVSIKKALKIRRALAKKDRNTYLPVLAGTTHNMGTFLLEINSYYEAEPYLNESLKLWRELASKNRDAYLTHIAMNLYNLGRMHYYKKSCSEAETCFNESLNIRRKLASENRDAYLSDLAVSLTGLANVYCYKNEFSEAETSYKECLQIYRELALKNPDAYFPSVATLLVNLSLFYQDNFSNMNLSLKYAKEAIDVLKNCKNSPYIHELNRKANQIIDEWSNNLP